MPNAVYKKDDCKFGDLEQIESIAHARLIARLSRQAGIDPETTGKVAPRVQWEVRFRSGEDSRIDIAVEQPSGDIGLRLIEVKNAWDGRDARRQLTNYVDGWNASNALRKAARYDLTGITDEFYYHSDRCGLKKTDPRRIKGYFITAAPAPGDAGVLRLEREKDPCEDTGTTTDEQESEELQTVVAVAGADDDHNGTDDAIDAIAAQPVAVAIVLEEEGCNPALVENMPPVRLNVPVPVRVTLPPAAVRGLVAGWCVASRAADGLAPAAKFADVVAPTTEALVKAYAHNSYLQLKYALQVIADAVDKLMLEWAAARRNSYGDPHLATFDRLSYDFQAVGEFHLARVEKHGVDVQVRYKPLSDSASLGAATAFDLGGDDVEITAAGRAYVNGELIPTSDHAPIDANGYHLVQSNGHFAAIFPTGEVVSVQGSAISMGLPEGAEAVGLLGNGNGNTGDDLVTATGEPVSPTATAVIHGRYADSWRITDAESAFTYADNESTATYTDKTFPKNVVTIADFTPAEIETASRSCTAHDVQPGPQFDDCVYDLLVTGDDTYAKAASAVTGDLVDPLYAQFDSTGVLHEAFDSPVATNFAHNEYLTDAATGKVAAPIFDTPGYQFYLVDVPRHDAVNMRLQLIAYGTATAATPTGTVDIATDSQTPITATLDGDQPSVSGTSGATITYVRAGTTATGTPFRIYQFDQALTHFGTALKVTLTPHNFRGILGTSLGVSDIRLQLDTTPARPFAVDLPFAVSPDHPSAGAGRLTTGGGEDDYTVTIPSGHAADLHLARENSDGIRVTLLDQQGQTVRSTEDDYRHLRFNNLEPGDYTVRVTTTAGATTYRLAGNLVPPDVAVTVDLDDPTTTVTTTAAGQDATVSFHGTAGQRVQVQTTDSTYSDLYWNVKNPDGTTLKHPYFRFSGNALTETFTLPASGTYQVLLDPQGTATGSVKLQARAIPDDVAVTVDLDDPTTTVTTTAAGQDATVSFHGTAGQRVQVQTTDSTYPGFRGLKWNVEFPDGSKLDPYYFQDNDLADTFTLPATGTYRVLLDPQNTNTGSVKVTARNVL